MKGDPYDEHDDEADKMPLDQLGPLPMQYDQVFGCSLFAGRRDEDGYGRVGRRKAHIIAWERARGPVPEGLVLDHVCRRRNCCALHHLEPVTQSENEKRKSWRYRAMRKTCTKGHDLRVHGAVTPEGGRVCRQCNREAKGQAS